MKNFILKYWNGEYPLAFSYWGIAVVLSNAIVYGAYFLVVALASYSHSLTYSAWIVISYGIFTCAFKIWVTIGVWRSSTNYSNSIQNKTKRWGSVAKFFIVIGVLTFIASLNEEFLPSLKLMPQFMFGGDTAGKINTELLDGGRTLKISGVFGNSSFNEINITLKNTPTIKRLYLSSNGGRLQEVTQIAQLVQNLKLETYVEDECLSFCTVVFLAGYPRYATPMAKIGFHKPSYGTDNEMSLINQTGIDSSTALYKSFNLPDDFVKKIFETPNDDMWYPSYKELLSSGVVSELSLGGQSNSIKLGNTTPEIIKSLAQIELFNKYEKKSPGFLNAAAEIALPLVVSGKSDTEVFNAIRAYIIPFSSKVIANSTPQIRKEFADLGKKEALEIAQFGSKACTAFLKGTLDITKILSKELVSTETSLLNKAIDSDFIKPNFTNEAYIKSIQTAAINMTPEELEAISAPSAKNEGAVCNGMVKFFTGIVNLPNDQQDILIYGMYKQQ
jgi:hypothetical protein